MPRSLLHLFRALAVVLVVAGLLGLTPSSNTSTLPMQAFVLAADQTESAATYTDVTGFSFTPEASSSYRCEFFGTASSTATTTAFWWKFVGPSGLDHSAVYLTQPTTSTATGFTNGPIATTAAEAATIAAVAGTPIYGWAVFRTGATPSGTLKVQFKSEVAAGQAVALKRGALMTCTKQE
jgi:hypothetical protein